MIEVTHYIVTFTSGKLSIRKGFKTKTFVSDWLDLIIFRYEIALYFDVPVGMVELITRENVVKLWPGSLNCACKYYKFKRNNKIVNVRNLPGMSAEYKIK